MWTVLRHATRRAAVPRALALCSSSRVAALRHAPVCARLLPQSRGFIAGRALAAKAVAAKKTPAKTPAGRKKLKPKAAVKKTKPVKKARKVLTPEEKVNREVRELKKVALLQEPARLPDRPWLVYVSSHTKGKKVNELGVTAEMKTLSQSFKTLSPDEHQRLEDTASRNKLANNASYKAWIETHEPVAIADANKARLRLKRISSSKKAAIQDDRQPKRPSSSYSLFCKSRWGSGDFDGQPIGDAAKALSSEWKALSAPERKPYEDLGKADADRYEKEMMDVLGRTIKRTISP